jgi:predicted permease
MLSSVGAILTFAAIVGIGVMLRSVGLARATDAHALNTVIIYVGLPAMIFRAMHRAVLGPEIGRVVFVAWLVFGVALGAAWALSRLMGVERPLEGGMLLAASFGNTGFIGYPVTGALIGASAVPLAVFSDVFGTVIALVLIGLPIAARCGTAEAARRHPIRELLAFPALIAAVVGLATRWIPVPDLVNSGLDLLANMVAPLIMISVGLSLRPAAILDYGRSIAGVAAVRLVLAPLVALGVVGLALADGGDAARVAVLQAGMPSMMITLVVGERYGLDTDFIASAIFVTTVLSAFTLPVVRMLAG